VNQYRGVTLLILLLFLVIHVSFLNQAYPLDKWSTPLLLVADDHPANLMNSIHGAQAKKMSQGKSGVIYVFSESAGALYTRTLPHFNGRINSDILHLFPNKDPIKVYNTTFFFMILLMPLIAFFSLYLIAKQTSYVFTGTVFIYIFYYWSHAFWGLSHIGMFFFIFALHLALLSWALIHNYLCQKEKIYYVLSVAVCSVAFYCHGLAPLIYLPFMLVLIGTCGHFTRSKKFILMLFCIITPVILNFNSIAGAWSIRSTIYPNTYLTGEGMDSVWGGLVEIFVNSHFWKAVVPLLLLILIGQYQQKMKIIWTIAMCIFFYMLLVVLGEPGRTWELPLMRYSSTLLFIMLAMSNMLSFKKMNAIRAYSIGGLCLFFLIMLGTSVTQSYAHYTVAPVFGVPRTSQEIINFINTEIDPSERILIEDSGWQEGHQYDKMHFVSILPHFVSSEIIGGPHPCSVSKYTSNRFVGGTLSGEPMSRYTRHMIDQYIDHYDIQWVISYSQEAKYFFRQHQDLFKKVQRIAQFSVYYVDRKSNRFLQGSGTAQLKDGKLFLDNIRSENHSIVIKYHWAPILSCQPACEILPVQILNDRVGFIKIEDPPEKIVIYSDHTKKLKFEPGVGIY